MVPVMPVAVPAAAVPVAAVPVAAHADTAGTEVAGTHAASLPSAAILPATATVPVTCRCVVARCRERSGGHCRRQCQGHKPFHDMSPSVSPSTLFSASKALSSHARGNLRVAREYGYALF